MMGTNIISPRLKMCTRNINCLQRRTPLHSWSVNRSAVMAMTLRLPRLTSNRTLCLGIIDCAVFMVVESGEMVIDCVIEGKEIVLCKSAILVT
jgi:hypothetical protein